MGVITRDKPAKDQADVAEEAPQEEQDSNTFEIDGETFTKRESPEGPESEGVQPVLLEGQTVHVIEGEHAGVGGRMAYIIGHTFASDADYLQFHTAGHPKRMFAKVESYQVETRDGRNEKFSVTPDEIRPLDSTNGWGRGSI